MGEPARTLTDADVEAIAERLAAKLRAAVPAAAVPVERERPPARPAISEAQRQRVEKRLRRAGVLR